MSRKESGRSFTRTYRPLFFGMMSPTHSASSARRAKSSMLMTAKPLTEVCGASTGPHDEVQKCTISLSWTTTQVFLASAESRAGLAVLAGICASATVIDLTDFQGRRSDQSRQVRSTGGSGAVARNGLMEDLKSGCGWQSSSADDAPEGPEVARISCRLLLVSSHSCKNFVAFELFRSHPRARGGELGRPPVGCGGAGRVESWLNIAVNASANSDGPLKSPISPFLVWREAWPCLHDNFGATGIGPPISAYG